MKRKLLFACVPFLSLIAVAAAMAVFHPRNWTLLLSLTLLVVFSLWAVAFFSRTVSETLSPLARLRQVLDYIRRLGIPLPRTAEDQVETLLGDVEHALDQVLRANSALEGKVKSRREELEASERRLQRAHAFLDSIVENIPDMIFVKDAKELRFVLFNKAGEELLGYSRDQLIGKNDYDFFPKNEADFFTAKDRQVLNRGKIVVIDEEPIHTRDGIKILHTKKIPLLDADGVPQFLLGISEDITARKESEARLNQRTRELAQAQIEKEQMELFAHVAAHDLREPAHKIASFGDLLSDHLPASGPARDYLGRMQSAAERMGRLIDDLLRFTKITKTTGKAEVVPLSPVVRQVIKDFDWKVSETGTRFFIGDLPAVEGDPVQFQEVFRNLIGNAMKFHHAGRTPEIRITAEERSEGAVAVTVQDNGIGFEPAYAERIFRPFERLHARHEYEGTGMGLAICQRIIDHLGASISARSKPGEGASFTIVFPGSRIAPPQAASVSREGK